MKMIYVVAIPFECENEDDFAFRLIRLVYFTLLILIKSNPKLYISVIVILHVCRFWKESLGGCLVCLYIMCSWSYVLCNHDQVPHEVKLFSFVCGCYLLLTYYCSVFLNLFNSSSTSYSFYSS